MAKILLHPHTKNKLGSTKAALPHALLLSGKVGVGLGTVAHILAGKELQALIEPVDGKGQINHDTGTITVSTIRQLYEQTRAKSTTRRFVIIDDADRMSLSAQAAFLKLLEEPGESAHFILTSHSARRLLPTIRSRLQTVNVEMVTDSQTKELIDELGISDPRVRIQLEYLAGGLPAELIRLTRDEVYFRQRADIMADTRTFLTGSTYQKLLIVSAYQHDRAKALQLLDSALAVSERSMRAKPHLRLVKQLDTLLATRERIEANCSIKLQLMAFVI